VFTARVLKKNISNYKDNKTSLRLKCSLTKDSVAIVQCSVADPDQHLNPQDPYIFGSPGFGSSSHK
jgi:hypothetical protein